MRDLNLRFPEPCDETWEGMGPVGCHRSCYACDTIVHDLTHYDADEIEALLRSGQSVCAKAHVERDGTIITKRDAKGSNMRRALVSASVSASLIASIPATARDKDRGGTILGETATFGFKTVVEAKGQSGKTFKTSVRRDGRYRFKNLPKGNYTLTFHGGCGTEWTIANINVSAGETFVPESPDAEICFIIGKLEIVENPAPS